MGVQDRAMLSWSFDWISPIFGGIQSNDHGSALNVEVFKAWRSFEHPYFLTE